MAVSFIGEGNPEKTTDLSQIVRNFHPKEKNIVNVIFLCKRSPAVKTFWRRSDRDCIILVLTTTYTITVCPQVFSSGGTCTLLP